MLGGRRFDVLFKILVVGDKNVGKTCLVYQFCEHLFSTTYVATIGIDFKIKTVLIDGKVIKLQIWDTAGEERFRSMTKAYFRGAHGILLVYDVTNYTSFLNVEKWLGHLNEYLSPNVPKMLLGNKCDCEEESRQVSHAQGHLVAIHRKMKFMEVSAKQDVNIERAFYQLTEAMLNERSRIGENGGQQLSNTKSFKLTANEKDSRKSSKMSRCCK